VKPSLGSLRLNWQKGFLAGFSLPEDFVLGSPNELKSCGETSLPKSDSEILEPIWI